MDAVLVELAKQAPGVAGVVVVVLVFLARLRDVTAKIESRLAEQGRAIRLLARRLARQERRRRKPTVTVPAPDPTLSVPAPPPTGRGEPTTHQGD